MLLRTATLGATAASLLLAADIVGDAQRGEQIFENQRCIRHSINGRGRSTAPDLGRHIGRELTPASMAALMWNHAPQMWSAMRQAAIVKGILPEESAGDLSAYFVAPDSLRNPAIQPVASRHSANCIAPIAMESQTLRPPALPGCDVEVAYRSHRASGGDVGHGPKMRQAYADRKLKWAPVTGQQLREDCDATIPFISTKGDVHVIR
jgi:hypothetical protein